MKLLFRSLSLALLGLIGLSSCADETLSQIGEQVQPQKDIVHGEHVDLQFTASTLATQDVYAVGTTSLLGQIADPSYGDFRGQFITEVRTARDFAFSAEPAQGSIDSVRLVVKFTNLVGNASSAQKVAVYEVEKGFAGGDFSVSDLDSYRKPSMLLGSRTVSPNTDSFYQYITSSDSVPAVSIPLEKELGQRLYQATKTHPEYFATQTAFSQNLLGGLLVTTTTGSGYVLQTSGISLEVFYHTASAPTQALRETFINTKYTPGLSAFTNTNIEGLVGSNSNYAYLKSPAGVHAELELSADELTKLVKDKGADIFRTGAWRLADVDLTLPVESFDNTLLNPPSYTLMIPRDSVKSFFENGYTELNTPNTAILSSQYSITNRFYQFGNISSVIYEHLRNGQNSHYDSSTKQWVVDRPLRLSILPVLRRVRTITGTSTTITAELTPNLVPALVRLRVDATTLKTKAIATEFNL